MNEVVAQFEKEIASFYKAPYAVAVDCCTLAIELCLLYTKANNITIQSRTYLSVPMTAEKLGLDWEWKDENWKNFYQLGNTNIIDAAVLWRPNSYVKNTFMCLSFQFQKHLSLGRGGMILTDDKDAVLTLKKMSYDGRIPNIPWREQNVDTIGYHYYMTPETAQIGLNKLSDAINTKPREWPITKWPDLRSMEIFK